MSAAPSPERPGSPTPGYNRRWHRKQLAINRQLCNNRYITPREQLLQKCLTYLLQHGVANFSLRPLAHAAGTSARMLIHYFGSKEDLLIAVMEKVRANFQSLFEAAAARTSERKAADLALGFWQSITSRRNLPYLRLLFEVQILAIQNPRRYKRYLVATSESWLSLVESALPQDKRGVASATLHTAVIDGLILELLSTGDFRRTSDALDLFISQFGDDNGKPRTARARTKKISPRR